MRLLALQISEIEELAGGGDLDKDESYSTPYGAMDASRSE